MNRISADKALFFYGPLCSLQLSFKRAGKGKKLRGKDLYFPFHTLWLPVKKEIVKEFKVRETMQYTFSPTMLLLQVTTPTIFFYCLIPNYGNTFTHNNNFAGRDIIWKYMGCKYDQREITAVFVQSTTLAASCGTTSKAFCTTSIALGIISNILKNTYQHKSTG